MTEEEVKTLIRGNQNFTERFYQLLSSCEENLFFSPFGIHTLLTLLSQDPGYHRKSAFTDVLNIYTELDIAAEAFRNILLFIHSSNNATCSVTCKAFFRDNYQLQESFRTLLTNNFSYEVQPLDLSAHVTASESINNWVENKTNKKIKELIGLSLDDATQLVLANTVTLKDKWAVPFNVENTAPATFHINERDTIEAQMMRMKMEVNYKRDEQMGAKILELPFHNDDLNLIIILPNKGTSLKELEDNLYYRNLEDITGDMSKQEIDISIPKFKIDHSVNSKTALSELGLSEELGENTYLFGMFENDEFICLDQIQQKAFIEVNEEGTEATTGDICTSKPSKADDDEGMPENGLTIYEMNIKSSISNRFAKNLVVCKIKNNESSAKEATFTVTLPETAFIIEFIMEIGGKTYKSLIKEKEEAKNIYNEAVASGKSAGIVEATTRDSNEFTVSVNLEPDSVAVFSLTYEEMLQCIHDQYELVLNIRPGQIVENLNVEVTINESKPLKFVRTPSLRSGNEISRNERYLKPSTDIKMLTTKTAVVKFSPDSKQQRKIAHYIGTPVSEGFSCQFVVEYSVERDPQGGEILLQDGYFVHFFAPNDLDPLPKHVVFVLDTSGSMGGRKISQLKDAMMSILAEIRKQDIMSIIEFNNNVIVWDINNEVSTSFFYQENYQDPFCALSEYALPEPANASDIIINKAKSVVQKITANGGTFMIGGLETALYLVKMGHKKQVGASDKFQPLIVFLTDGEPNVGLGSTKGIVEIVTRLNFSNDKVPIFSLSFGSGADKQFLRNLSLKNLGFSRHIYEASDASLQLQAFYKQISSPLLNNIKFKYDSEVKDLTKSNFPIYFKGSELVVSGRCQDSAFPAYINCCGPLGPIILKPIIERPITSLERLWAYLTVKQLLEERNSVEDKTALTKKAVDLALKYSFVTEVTSLVVVKPNETNAVNAGMDDAEDPMEELSGGCLPGQQAFRSAFKRKMCSYAGVRGGGGEIINYLEAEINLPSLEVEKQPPQEEFVADHPFLIYLLFKKEDKVIVLFKGHVLKPTY